MFIDIHAHLNDKILLPDVESVVSRAKNVGVGKIVCVGSDYQSSLCGIELANKFENVYATIGLHPNDCYSFDSKIEELILKSKDNPKVIAIGEIGLDYYDIPHQLAEANLENISEDNFIKKQREVFLKQLEFADKVNLPIMIHMRDATNDTLTMLENNKNLIKNGGLLHCYNGSIETTKKIFDLGFYISIGGAITFKNSRNMPAVLKEIGLQRVLLETDCPYLSPEPYRGKVNEPKNIPLIAAKIAEITGNSIEKVEKITTENCYKVFKRLKDTK
ncbi:MAG: TatD family hydrolase [Clostridia bacterium]|nr:TatD family hydrolase [Clostridia bacterium]